MTKPQEIQKKIRELVPELQELSKGCEVVVDSKFGIQGYGNVQCVKEYIKALGEVSLYGHNTCGKDYNLEIIGHPIHLEHVLQAIEKKGEVLTPNGLWKLYRSYNLFPSFEENLENEELCEFLYELICK